MSISAIETANPDQLAAWNGDEGESWAANADRFEEVGHSIWERHLDGIDVERSHRVLDVGCGTGGSTRDLAALAIEGRVLGVDLSAPMLDVARTRAAQDRLDNLEFLQADAQIHRFEPASFDLVVSSFGAMFFSDPVAAFANLGTALDRDGVLSLLAWRELDRNGWIAEIRSALAMGRELPVPPPDAPSPFSLADADRVGAILGQAGFADVDFDEIVEPMVFGTDVDDALAFIESMGIVEWLTRDLDADDRAEALRRLRRTVEEHDGPGGVAFGSSAWSISARRRS